MPGRSTPALQAWIEQQFGGAVEVSTADVSVGTSATLAAANDMERMGLLLMNLSANNIYLAPDNGVSSSHGILLIGSGSSLALNYRNDLVMPGWSWYALASVAASDLFVVKVKRYTEG